MFKVIFNHNGQEIEIQCNINEGIKEIFQKYEAKANIDKVFYLYNGENINKELKVEEIINQNDKKSNEMKVLVIDTNIPTPNGVLIELKEIICPKCNENVIINLKDYKLEMKCKNNHNNKIFFKDYNNRINISEILCNQCNKKRSESYKYNFFICLKCNINLCPLCKSQHDQNHEIINYDNKNYICNKHNENFIKYCCNRNICIECEKEHKGHKSIYYGDILPDDSEKNKIKESIDSFTNEIKKLINKLNDLMKNIESYYNIYNNSFDVYHKKKKNYEILQNINEFIDFNKTLIKDINLIIENNNINKLNDIMKMYEKMNSQNIDFLNQNKINKENKNKTNNDYPKNQISDGTNDLKSITPYKKEFKAKSKGSWEYYIDSYLLNPKFKDEEDSYLNILCGAAIIGHNSYIWSSTDNLELSKNEIIEIDSIINDTSKIKNTITIKGLTFTIEGIDKNKYIYLSRFDGGGTIGKTNQAYIIGIYNKNIICKKKGENIKQNQKLCNKAVKTLTEELKGNNL